MKKINRHHIAALVLLGKCVGEDEGAFDFVELAKRCDELQSTIFEAATKCATIYTEFAARLERGDSHITTPGCWSVVREVEYKHAEYDGLRSVLWVLARQIANQRTAAEHLDDRVRDELVAAFQKATVAK